MYFQPTLTSCQISAGNPRRRTESFPVGECHVPNLGHLDLSSNSPLRSLLLSDRWPTKKSILSLTSPSLCHAIFYDSDYTFHRAMYSRLICGTLSTVEWHASALQLSVTTTRLIIYFTPPRVSLARGSPFLRRWRMSDIALFSRLSSKWFVHPIGLASRR
jgi:hypothetical protein